MGLTLEEFKKKVNSSYKIRERTISKIGRYIAIYKDKPEKQKQVCDLLWYLFGDYIDSWNFDYIKPFGNINKCNKKKHLYILKSDRGFYKIGITNNVKKRVIDLKFEFDDTFEIINILKFKGFLENKIHSDLIKYKESILKKDGIISNECFKICDEVNIYLTNLTKNG